MKKYLTLFMAAMAVSSVSFAQLGTITTIAGTGINAYGGDTAAATAASLNSPRGVAVDASGNIYIADVGNQRIRKISAATGNIITIAGTGVAGYGGDGGPAIYAQLHDPESVIVDASGNLYIADVNNNVVRKINTSGTISTIAGNGVAGYSGDGYLATSAKLTAPYALAFDKYHNLYIADVGNGRIRKVDMTNGTITTAAGSGGVGYRGDGGTADTATFHYPVSVVVDTAMNIFVADQFNNAIRKIDNGGYVSTVIGGEGAGGYSGDGGPCGAATLRSPSSLSLDAAGNLYITDRGNNCIRKVNTTGKITTMVGVGSIAGSFSGDNGPAAAAGLYNPYAIAWDGTTVMYIADANNNRIRKVKIITTSVTGETFSKEELKVYPNPANNKINVNLQGLKPGGTLSIYNLAGALVSRTMPEQELTTINIDALNAGLYFVSYRNSEAEYKTRLVKIGQ